MTISSEFAKAIDAAMADHESLASMEDRPLTDDAPEMRAVGIARTDALHLTMLLHNTYGDDLEHGDKATLLAIIEICLSTGVHLERARWNEYEKSRKTEDPDHVIAEVTREIRRTGMRLTGHDAAEYILRAYREGRLNL